MVPDPFPFHQTTHENDNKTAAKLLCTMDKLSHEIISLIAGNIEGPLATYAVISRVWQSVIEARTFSQVRLKSGSMDTLHSALAPAHAGRRKALQKLCFDVELPKWNDKRADYRKNLDVFRQAVAAFFQRLATWEGADKHFQLAIETSYAENEYFRELEAQGFGVFDSCSERGDRSALLRRYLALRDTDLQEVPRISCVSSFVVPARGPSIHPTACFRMARCFQGLEELSLSYFDPVKRRHALRQEHRQAVADGVKSLRNLPCLRKLRITACNNRDPADHSFAIQDFRDDRGVDALCEAIRCLAQAGHLVELELEDTLVSADLFQDRRVPPGEREAIPWPSLERFSIRQGLVAPDGRW